MYYHKSTMAADHKIMDPFHSVSALNSCEQTQNNDKRKNVHSDEIDI